MKIIGVYLLGLIFGVAAVYGYSTLATTDTKEGGLAKMIQPPTSFPKFSIESPPSQALKGEIASSSGSLLWESRIATSPSKLDTKIDLQQGERLQTQASSSATINFAGKVIVEMGENSDIALVQTLPVDFVATHHNGSITYKAQAEVPISIIIRNALLTISKGSVLVEMESGVSTIAISPVGGDGDIGFNDTDIVSQVYTLVDGEIYEYDSDERTAINVEKR